MPFSCDLETCSGIRRVLAAGAITESTAIEALGIYIDLPLARFRHLPLLWRVFELRASFTPYDAAYVALCERLSATLVTCDLRLTRAAQLMPSLNVVGVAGA